MKLKFLFLGIIICSAVSGQNFVMKRMLADRYYNRYDYYKAIPMYEQLLKSFPRNYAISEKLADSYRRINDSEKAEPFYARLMDTSLVKPEYMLQYAQVLARNGKYDQAGLWYAKYGQAQQDDPRGRLFARAYEHIYSFYKDSASYQLLRVPFNSELSDFSPAYYGNGLMFVSARHRFSIVRLIYNWTYSAYLDLYFAKSGDANASPIDKGINTIYHEGPVTFNKAQDSMLFTRSNFYKFRFRKSNEGIHKLKLFQARYDGTRKRWIDVKPLPFNSNEYSVGHPALAENGQTLYFASDMPGGFGGTDIYVSHQITDSMGHKGWSKPQNMGGEINSAGNEMFPFVDNQGNLWFASNGLPGLGGLDIFMARKKGKEFEKPVNAGFPINSRFDDFGLITQSGGFNGYLSSDRYSSPGNDDIFFFKLTKLSIRGFVCDSADYSKALNQATVLLLTSDSVLVSHATTDADGKFTFPLNLDEKYILKVSRSGYLPQRLAISTASTDAAMDITLPLAKEATPKVELYGTIVEKTSGEKLQDVHIVITDSLTHTVVLNTITSADGSFRKSVPSIKLNDNLVYSVQISKKGYLAKSVLFLHKVAGFEINLNDFLEVSLNKIDLGTDIGKLLDLKPIYFDLGKANIRPDAAKELDKVVKAMNDNPTIKIELGSHTDSRGTSASNMTLSEKRAKSAAEYLYSKGIDRGRIISKGYGDTKPLNRCVKGVKCTEEEYQLNRRTEFKILSVE